MKLDCVVTAVNENPLYLEFIPIFIKTWKKLYCDVDIKIILIANKIPDDYNEYKQYIILFEPIPNITTSFISQYIRLLYPCILNYQNGVMITDMDILPMNRHYYTDNIASFDNNKFIYFRGNVCLPNNEVAMCYNVATPSIWKEIFNIQDISDIQLRLKIVYENNHIVEGHGNIGWNIDQRHLYNYIRKWKNNNNFVCLFDRNTKYCRLDRNKFHLTNIIKQNIQNGLYSDYHCYRPMKRYVIK
jgi:hypothetical protein